LALDRLEACLRLLGSLDPGALPVHHASVLVWLAQRSSATYAEIEEAFGVSNASVSRTLNSLGENALHRKNSLGLVEIYRDGAEGRRYRVRLNKKGREFMRALDALSNPAPTTTTTHHDHHTTGDRLPAK
jgi:DNA-binding MarR family transcriptional regulator